MLNVQTHLKNALNPHYWRELNPDLEINKETLGQSISSINPNKEILQNLKDSLMMDGYFQTNPILPIDEIITLRRSVEKIKQADWLPVFAFVYDEFWQIRSHLSFIMSEMLGQNYWQLPDFWAWYVEGNCSSRGWPPHRDRLVSTEQADGTPNSLSVWIPLTDATIANGCIYVLPSSLDKSFSVWFKAVIENIQGIRALPASAGSILGWKQSLLHWGAQSSMKASNPRISLGFEFQRGNIEPFNNPLLDPSVIPSFEHRLGLIGRQILQYQHILRHLNQNGDSPDKLVLFAEELQQLLS